MRKYSRQLLIPLSSSNKDDIRQGLEAIILVKDEFNSVSDTLMPFYPLNPFMVHTSLYMHYS